MQKIKKTIIFVFIFLMMNLVSAVQIGISPSSMEFNGNINEKICNKIILFSNSNETIIGETRWSSNTELIKDLKDYNLKPEDLSLKLEYPEVVNVENKKNIEMCLISENSGVFYGVLLYKTQNKPAGVGVWISVNINGNEFNGPKEYSMIKLTGNVIGSDEKIDLDKIKIALTFTSLVLFLLFISLMIINRRKIKK